MEIRRIDIGETQAFWNLQKQLDQETHFMMYEPDERKYEIGKAVSQIAHVDFIIGAVEDGDLIGYLSAKIGAYLRLKKTAYLVIGILKAYQGRGIGHQLFEHLEAWTHENGIHRLELTVLVTNAQAIALYQKNGFKIEGVRQESMCVDGQFIDEFYMSKIYD